MRLRFFAPIDETETEAHLAMLRHIDDFWHGVTRMRDRLVAGSAQSACETLAHAIARVDGGLLVEWDDLRDEEAHLVVSPREDPALGALADAVISRAPRLEGIVVERHAAAQEAPLAFEKVRSQARIDLSRAEARAGFARGHLIDVIVYSSAFPSAIDGSALDAANMAVRLLVGDRYFDEWIEAVDIVPIPRASSLRVLSAAGANEPERFALAELHAAITRAIAGVRASLASEPYHLFCERAEWTLLELAPVSSDDYSAQDDLLSCATMLPEMMKCYLDGARFASCRFSNHDECFAYVKIDMAAVDPKERLQRRIDLEEALNFALVPGRVGCVVSAGLGLRYVYVGLALQQLEAGIDITRRAVQRLKFDRRAWVLFCDSVWRHEWVGAYDDSPPPP